AIAGIVVGTIVLIILIIVCAWFYLKGRNGKQSETELYEKSSTPSAAAAATTAEATAASASHYHNPDYPNSYDQQDNYYPDQNGYGDSSAQHLQDQSYFPQHAGYSAEQQDNGYYSVDDHNNTLMMQNFDNGNSRDKT
ncbi:hypothetical protein BGX26_009590, partial [Mortierella sp. AD094]